MTQSMPQVDDIAEGMMARMAIREDPVQVAQAAHDDGQGPDQPAGHRSILRTLALGLQPVNDWQNASETMATDGTHLYYDPAWVLERKQDELRGLWAHEVPHCALGHPFRQGSRDQRAGTSPRIWPLTPASRRRFHPA